MEFVDILESQGYPVQTFYLVTPDDVRLTLYQVPFGLKSSNCSKKKIVFLQHGFLSSPLQFFANLQNQSLGYLLANQGFELWFGSTRDSKLVEGDISKLNYVSMLTYDIPHLVQYVLDYTNAKCVHYIGFSQGATLMYQSIKEIDKFHNKICQFFALAPVIELHSSRKILKVNNITNLLNFQNSCPEVYNGFYYKASIDSQLSNLVNQSLRFSYLKSYNCYFQPTTVLYYLEGSRPSYSNMQRSYIQAENITKIPTYVYYSSTENLADPYYTKKKFNEHLFLNVTLEDYPDFNHLDFMYALNATVIYNKIIQQLID